MRIILNFSFFILNFIGIGITPVFATHIVGGEITYRCFGGNQYEIKLTVFRDCDTGVPFFDNPAAIGIFDSDNNLISNILVPFSGVNDTLDPTLDNPCFAAPPNVCIHRTEYTTEVVLPFRLGGYRLAYQRCCRNQDIVNIVNPLNTGATYDVFISEQALLGCNNSAVFNEWPPVYICKDEPILFDHSATDIDGDIIIYELCAPLDGATPTSPQPQPPNAPPYSSVIWMPSYGLTDVLGNPADPLAIDANTGLLTGTPDDIGVYVVGICAKEYRNGFLISTTRRDFQYATGICEQTTNADFLAQEQDCGVSFINQSTSIAGEYIWDFGDTTNNDFSDDLSPFYTYSDSGFYQVTLIIDPNGDCPDTITQTIEVTQIGASVDVNDIQLVCREDTVVIIADAVGGDLTYTWTPENTAIITGQGTDSLVVLAGDDASYQVVVENQYGCSDSATSVINTSQSTPIVDITASSNQVIEGESIQLFGTFNLDYTYTWRPDTTLSTWGIYNPNAAPLVATTYYLTVTNSLGCKANDSIRIEVVPPPCGRPLVFIPNAFTPNGDGQNDVLFVRGTNLTDVYLTVYNRWGEMVFETNDINMGWDGYFRGELLNPDVYGYYLRCRCEGGEEYFEKGNVTLLR